jgi:Bacterial surface protein, Ig-like domain/HYR domain
MLYSIKKSIFSTLKNTTLFIIMLTSSLIAYAGVYKQGTLDTFNGVAENGTELIAVGDIGSIYTRVLSSSSAWVSQSTGSVFRLLDVDAAASYEDIAVGELGTILTRRSGSATWSSENSGTLLSLRKVLVDPNNGNNIIVGDEGLILFYDKILNLWAIQTSGTTENLVAIVANSASTLYTALGEKGAVLTSTDGKNWTVQSGFNAFLNDAIFYTASGGVDRYLAVGGIAVYESSDGINWSYFKNLIGSSQPYSFLNGISYSAATNTLTVVGDDGLKLTSTDDGANWSGVYGSYTINAPINNYDSNYTATYGKTLAASTSGISISNLDRTFINDMHFNAATGLYVAVGKNAKIITSTDGKTWSNSNFVSAVSQDIISVSFGGGTYAAITTAGNLLLSTNGIDWTTNAFLPGSIGATILDIAVDSSGSLFVVISGTDVWSGDGATWTSNPIPYLNSVIYSAADSLFVAVGDSTIKTSPDGLNWTNRSTGAAQGELRRLNDVIYNTAKGLYVAVGKTSTTHLVMTSPDTVTWTMTNVDTNASGPELFSVTYDGDYNAGSGQYVAVGFAGVMVSPDGATWTPVKDAASLATRFSAVVYDATNQQYVAAGQTAISVFTSQLLASAFTPAAPVTTIESSSLYMTITPELTLLKTKDYRGRSVLPTLISVAPNSAPYTMGPYTLTWEAIDNSGNRARFDQSIVIEDTTAPILTLTGQALIPLEAGSAYIDAGATVTDAVDSSVTIVTAGSYVDTNTVGDFTITYNAMDFSGNSATEALRTIRISDTVAPTISVSNVSVYTMGVLTAVQLVQPVTSDVTSITVTNDAPANGYPVGNTLVTWTATDAAGNQATASQTVTILADNQKPQITLNGQASVTVLYASTYTDAGASVSDDVDSNISLVTVNPVDTNAVGSYTLTYNATDYTGNVAVQVTRTVNVVDQQAPVVTLTGSASMRIEVGTAFTDPGATVTDNVSSNLNINVTGSVNSNVVGNYTLTYTATDNAGNTGSVTRAIEVFASAGVVDTENPVIVAPAALVINSPDGNGISNSDPRIQAFLSGASATDNVGILVIGPDATPGTFPIGTTNVTFSASDFAGNQSTATSSITITAPPVVDTTPPVITVAQSVSLSSTDGNGLALTDSAVQLYLNSVQVVDDSGVFTLSVSVLPNTLPIGTTSVTFTAVDDAGNQAQATGSIIIVDNSSSAGNGSGGGGGGGSMGWFMFLMGGIVFLTRRFNLS